jgi:hypothetical protein
MGAPQSHFARLSGKEGLVKAILFAACVATVLVGCSLSLQACSSASHEPASPVFSTCSIKWWMLGAFVIFTGALALVEVRWAESSVFPWRHLVERSTLCRIFFLGFIVFANNMVSGHDQNMVLEALANSSFRSQIA